MLKSGTFHLEQARQGREARWTTILPILFEELEEVRSGASIGIHLHQTRHIYARMVSEDTSSMVETQEALGHRNLATTWVYVNSIAFKRDKHSGRISDRLGI